MDRAGICACRFLAVVALQFAVDRLVLILWVGILIHHSIRIFIGPSRFIEDRFIVKRNLWRREIVDLVAGLFAAPAAYTCGQIGEHSKTIGPSFKVTCCGCLGTGPNESGGAEGAYGTQKASARDRARGLFPPVVFVRVLRRLSHKNLLYYFDELSFVPLMAWHISVHPFGSVPMLPIPLWHSKHLLWYATFKLTRCGF
jgi:hypothetical protein